MPHNANSQRYHCISHTLRFDLCGSSSHLQCAIIERPSSCQLRLVHTSVPFSLETQSPSSPCESNSPSNRIVVTKLQSYEIKLHGAKWFMLILFGSSYNTELSCHLFLQLVTDKVSSTNDLADLEDTVCFQTLARRK